MTDQNTTENAATGGTGEAVCSASWQVELNCECPKCGEYVNLLGVRPWDVVTLKGCTSHYRVYSMPGGKFLYACLYADCIATSDNAVVDRILPNNMLTVSEDTR